MRFLQTACSDRHKRLLGSLCSDRWNCSLLLLLQLVAAARVQTILRKQGIEEPAILNFSMRTTPCRVWVLEPNITYINRRSREYQLGVRGQVTKVLSRNFSGTVLDVMMLIAHPFAAISGSDAVAVFLNAGPMHLARKKVTPPLCASRQSGAVEELRNALHFTTFIGSRRWSSRLNGTSG